MAARRSWATASSPRTTPRSRGARRGRLGDRAGSIAPPPHRVAPRRSCAAAPRPRLPAARGPARDQHRRPDDHRRRPPVPGLRADARRAGRRLPVARPARADPRLHPRRGRRRRRGRPTPAVGRHPGGARARDPGPCRGRARAVPAAVGRLRARLRRGRPGIRGPARARIGHSAPGPARATPERHRPQPARVQCGRVVGPAIGGIVVATVGIAAAYALDALSYVAAIATLLFMAPIPPSPGAVRPSLTGIADGLRFAWRRRPVRATFVVDLMAMVFGSPRSLFPAMALDVFGVGPAGVGLLSSATALGAMVAALFAGWTTRVRHPGPRGPRRGDGLGPRDRRVRAVHLQLPAGPPVPGDRLRRGRDQCGPARSSCRR